MMERMNIKQINFSPLKKHSCSHNSPNVIQKLETDNDSLIFFCIAPA